MAGFEPECHGGAISSPCVSHGLHDTSPGLGGMINSLFAKLHSVQRKCFNGRIMGFQNQRLRAQIPLLLFEIFIHLSREKE